MAPHKHKLNQRISTVLTDDCLHVSLEKLVGASSKTPSYISVQSIIQSLDVMTLDASIDTFISKFGQAPYKTLDELLLANTASNLSSNPYIPSTKTTPNLFEGLDSLLD